MKISLKFFIVFALSFALGQLCSAMNINQMYLQERAGAYLKINESCAKKVEKVKELTSSSIEWHREYLYKSFLWACQLEDTNVLFSIRSVPEWGRDMQKKVVEAKVAVLKSLLDILPLLSTRELFSSLRSLPCLERLMLLQELPLKESNDFFIDIYTKYELEIELFFKERRTSC